LEGKGRDHRGIKKGKKDRDEVTKELISQFIYTTFSTNV
jgi:hypothetical protein